ncbi:RNA recognition motif 2-domain-containing protein [Spinellus fusiger]|nr:RNA recognition motif 2-domain-containing protein [Spinellus fusiger]
MNVVFEVCFYTNTPKETLQSLSHLLSAQTYDKKNYCKENSMLYKKGLFRPSSSDPPPHFALSSNHQSPLFPDTSALATVQRTPQTHSRFVGEESYSSWSSQLPVNPFSTMCSFDNDYLGLLKKTTRVASTASSPVKPTTEDKSPPKGPSAHGISPIHQDIPTDKWGSNSTRGNSIASNDSLPTNSTSCSLFIGDPFIGPLSLQLSRKNTLSDKKETETVGEKVSEKTPQPQNPHSPKTSNKAIHLSCETLSSVNDFDINPIVSGKDVRTTFMIRNIPNKYTQQMLIECIDATHKNTYDFLYLRIDFKNKCNVGYAFINFIDVKSVISFANEHVGKRWNRFNSEKRCTLSYANIQGKEALVNKFRNSNIMEENEAYRPKIFVSSGCHQGQEEKFPLPTVSLEIQRYRQQIRNRREANYLTCHTSLQPRKK